MTVRECLECKCQLCGGLIQRASRTSGRWIHVSGDKAHGPVPVEHRARDER